ncbi:MSCRAMM family adhesin SdrC, partial [Patescibacteria group bacterium]|nr:MSCRAMM family adhesin SdrC [Patescibacteria group bacterium]
SVSVTPTAPHQVTLEQDNSNSMTAGTHVPSSLFLIKHVSGTGAINGIVWDDSDGDGIHDNGESTVFSGVTLELTGTTTTGAALSIETQTNLAGIFSFTGAAVSSASGYTTSVNDGAGIISSDYLNTTFTSSGGNIIGTGSSITLEFGYVRSSIISGVVFVDSNEDGSYDAGETVFSGKSLSLSGTSSTGGTISVSAITTSTGAYSLENLPPGSGSYVLVLTPPDGYTAITTNSRSVAITSGGSSETENFRFEEAASDDTPDVTPTTPTTTASVISGGTRGEQAPGVLSMRVATKDDAHITETPTVIEPLPEVQEPVIDVELPTDQEQLHEAPVVRPKVVEQLIVKRLEERMKYIFDGAMEKVVEAPLSPIRTLIISFLNIAGRETVNIAKHTGEAFKGATQNVIRNTQLALDFLETRQEEINQKKEKQIALRNQQWSAVSYFVTERVGIAGVIAQRITESFRGAGENIAQNTQLAFELLNAHQEEVKQKKEKQIALRNQQWSAVSDFVTDRVGIAGVIAQRITESFRGAKENVIGNIEVAMNALERNQTLAKQVRQLQQQERALAWRITWKSGLNITKATGTAIAAATNKIGSTIARAGDGIAVTISLGIEKVTNRRDAIAQAIIQLTGETGELIVATLSASQNRIEVVGNKALAYVRNTMREIGSTAEFINEQSHQTVVAINYSIKILGRQTLDATQIALSTTQNSLTIASQQFNETKSLISFSVDNASNKATDAVKNAGRVVARMTNATQKTGIKIAQNTTQVLSDTASLVAYKVGITRNVVLNNAKEARKTIARATQNSVTHSIDMLLGTANQIGNAKSFIALKLSRSSDATILSTKKAGVTIARTTVKVLKNGLNAVEKTAQQIADTGNLVAFKIDQAGEAAIHTAVTALDRTTVALERGKNSLATSLRSVKKNATRMLALRPAAPELPPKKQYRTQLKRIDNKTLIATLHMSVFDSFGDPHRNTPVVLFSTPKIALTDNEGTATFHDVETGEHQLEVHVKEGVVESRKIIIEPPSGLTHEEQERFDVILPVIQVIVDEPVHGAATSVAGLPLYVWIIIILLASSNTGLIVVAWRRRRIKN